jgi:hypothetical protein
MIHQNSKFLAIAGLSWLRVVTRILTDYLRVVPLRVPIDSNGRSAQFAFKILFMPWMQRSNMFRVVILIVALTYTCARIRSKY